MKTTTLRIATVLLGAATLLTQPVFAGNAPTPGQSSAFGRSLTQWQSLYWPWYYGLASLATDANGNAVVNGVVLMGLPDAPGDGTPGHLDVTLNHGQPFFLPLWTWLGTSYTDGTPDDPHVNISVFQTLDISFQIDGATVLNGNNVMHYYSASDYNPAVALPPDFAPLAALIWHQGISIAHAPLRPGTHTMKLDIKNLEPVFGAITEYHNTWTVTVLP